MRGRDIVLWAGLGLVGCGGPYSTSVGTTTGITGVDTRSSEDSSTSGDNHSSTSDANAAGSVSASSSTDEVSTGSSSETAGVLDVGVDVDFGEPGPPGCKGKIDFLFVISRYDGMIYFQDQLIDAFPKFIQTIQTKFAEFDYHIMVVEGTRYWAPVGCKEMCPAQCFPGFPCHYTPTACDEAIGGGVVYPVGMDGSNKFCGINGGRRYMTHAQANLLETFSCVANLGIGGWDLLGEALTAAMQPEINAPGGCNAGFLRDDAVLMVTMISNTYDQVSGSMGTPEDWMAAVRTAKHGNLDSVVMLSILQAEQPDCHVNDRICQLVEMFPHHLRGDIFEPDLGPYFDQATDMVEAACAEFTPPG